MYLDSRFKTYREQREFLLQARVRCDESLLYFTRFFFKEITGNKFIVNWHHEEICENLKRVENYDLELLNINIPPRFSKTELAAVNFIARGIGMNPTGNYLYITASDELRAQTSISIRDIVTHPFFKIMYGVELKKDQNGKNLWRTKQGGGLKTATIFGQITGFGAGIMKDVIEDIRTFEGCIVMDDINKLDDSQVENANNDKVSRTVFNTVLSRKNSKDTPIINIQQRAGLSDITAEFMEHFGENNPKAEFLVMPVISEEGVPLWKWKHDIKEIEKLKTSPKTSHVFETQYMQNPLPSEGVFFAQHLLNWFEMREEKKLFKELDSIYKSVSFSFSGNDECLVTYFNDRVVNIRCKGHDFYSLYQLKVGNIDVADEGKDYLSFPSGVIIGENVYITDWIYTQDNSDKTLPQVSTIINSNNIDYTGIEANNMGMQYAARVKEQMKSGLELCPKYSDNKTDKMGRIAQKQGYIKRHFYFLSNTHPNSEYNQALKHLYRIQKDGSFKVDDSGDSLAGKMTLIQTLGREGILPQFNNI